MEDKAEKGTPDQSGKEQSEDEILSYWRCMDQKKVKPLPLPTIAPLNLSKKSGENPEKGEQEKSEPTGPDK